MAKLRLGNEVLEYLRTKKSGTQSVYQAGLRAFLKFYQKEHGENATLSDFLNRLDENANLPRRQKKRLAEEELNTFIDYFAGLGKSNNIIRTYFAAIQNFLKYKGFEVSGRFVKLPEAIPIEKNEKHAWKIEEIKQFVDSANSIRDKAIILCLFQSGLSIGDLCAIDYKDIREDLERGILPIRLRLYRQKTKVQFTTFFGRDAIKYLKIYLETRHNLKSNTPLFTMSGSDTERLTTSAVQQKFSEFAKTLPFLNNHKDEDEEEGFNPVRPHSLRAAFRSRLTNKIDPYLIEFLIGHKVPPDKMAYLNIPEDELRQTYANFEHLLAIEKTSKDELVEKQEVKIPPQIEKEIADLKTTVSVLSTKIEEEKKSYSHLEDVFSKTVDKMYKRIRKLEIELDMAEDEEYRPLRF